MLSLKPTNSASVDDLVLSFCELLLEHTDPLPIPTVYPVCDLISSCTANEQSTIAITVMILVLP